MKRGAPRRDWSAARAKVEAEARCRIDGCLRGYLQAAHTVGRKYDAIREDGVRVVAAVDVVPLCPDHHELYDAGRLDLLPYLTREEQAAIVVKVGLIGGMRRACGSSPAWR